MVDPNCAAVEFEHRQITPMAALRPHSSQPIRHGLTALASLILFLTADSRIIAWADRFLAREGFLSNVRKRPVPHEGQFKIAGYFYYYGIYYFTESVRLLPQETHAAYATQLAAILMERQEKDGSWWDYPLYNYHQAYGTGYALMALAWCRDAIAGHE